MHATEVAVDESRRSDAVGLLFLYSALVLPSLFIVDKFINSGRTMAYAGVTGLLVAAWSCRSILRTRRTLDRSNRPTASLASTHRPRRWRDPARGDGVVAPVEVESQAH